MKTVFTPEQVANNLGLSRRTIVTWLQAGKLPGIKVGNRWRIKQEDLDKFLNEPNVFFKDYAHQTRFLQLRQKTQFQTNEEISFLYLIACLNKPLDEFIGKEKVDVDGILRSVRLWGSTERALVQLALGLLEADRIIDLNEVFSNLDRKSFEAAIQAIRLRW
jgi:excisionase family DNA binding protein